MNLDFSLHLSSKKYKKCLCFTHAVQEALKGDNIIASIEEKHDEYVWSLCEVCDELNWPFEKKRK